MSSTVNIKSKPIELVAIQWVNNEAEIRDFVQDDSVLAFRDSGLQIWNTEELSWINVPMFHWIVRGLKGELNAVSQELFNRVYEVVE